MGVQRTIWDIRDIETQEPIFEQQGLVMGEPLSIRMLADNLGQDADPLAPMGDQHSGCQRDKLTSEVDECLQAFSESAHKIFSSEYAAILLMRMCARVPDFEAPEWLRQLFDAHLDVLREVAARGLEHGRDDDFAEGRNDDDE